MLREISLHILDIAENSIQAGAGNVNIKIIENQKDDRLRVEITDDGKGMDENTTKQVIDPFFTSRTTRKVGLGLPFLKEAAEACNGLLEIKSEVGKGTTIYVEFQLSHIDRMPLGDIENTFLNLLIGYPEVHWVFEYENDHKVFFLDDAVIKNELAGIPLSEPVVLVYLRELIFSGIKVIHTN